MCNALEDDEDESFAAFLDPNYNSETFANAVIAGAAVGQTLEKLKSGVLRLDNELQNQVCDHYDDLVSQATGVDILDEALCVIRHRVQVLQRSMSRIQTRISEPHKQILARTKQLSRLQETCDVVRRVTRIQYLSKRLKQQLEGGIKEIAKTSQTFNELEFLFGDGDLKGIDVVDADMDWILQARKDMETQAEQLLVQGLSSLNQNQTSTALQVFHSMSSLKPTVSRALNERCVAVRDGLGEALKGTTESSGGRVPGGSSLGNTAAWRAGLWTALDKWSSNVCSSYNQIHVLHRTLVRRRDPITHRTLLEECELEPLQSFVTQVHTALQDKLRDLSSSAKQALDVEYPKALRLVLQMWTHFNGKMHVEGLEDVKLPVISARDVLFSHQCSYLARSLNRLLDPVNLAFPGKNVPSISEIEGVVRIIVSELNAARGDEELRTQSVSNVVKTVRSIISKCEGLVHSGPQLASIDLPPNDYHTKNIQVLNVLSTLHKRLTDIPDHSKLHAVLNEVWLSICDILDILLAPFRAKIEQVFNTIHDTDYGFERQDIMTGCSQYISQIEEVINTLSSHYLSLLNTLVIQPKIIKFHCSLLSLYLHHLCVLRPLGEGGKMKLATDIAEIERVFLPISEGSTDTFKTLRSFRAVLFLTTADIVTVRSVPKELLLNHVFSRAGPVLPSPYKIAGWTPAQYVAWLCSHPGEVREMVQGTVQWYEDMVRESGAPEFDPVYPVILKMLK